MKNLRKTLSSVMCGILVLVMILGCLTGCGSNETASSNAEAAANNAEATTDGKIVVCERIGTDPTTLSPWGVESSGGDAIRTVLYERLLFKNVSERKFENWLAESIEQISETSYQVKIYDYITDTEGNPMTADDIIFSFEKAIEAGTVTNKVSCLESMEKIDDYTVQFNLYPEPASGAFESCLAYVNCVTKAAFDNSGDEMALNPVGTSNYKLVNAVSGSNWTFEKTNGYWQTDESLRASCAAGNADGVVMSVITDTSAAAVALESGQVDVSMISATDAPNFMNEDGSAKDGFVCETVGGLSVQMYFTCCEESPTSDVNLRKAIAYCLDRDAIGYALYGKNGPAMNSIVALNWMDGDYGQTPEDYFTQDYDLAREYLAKSNYNGEVIRIMVVTPMAKAGPLIQAYLAEIGINAELLNYDRATFNSYANDAAYGNYDIVVQNVGSDANYPWLALGYLDGSAYEGGLNRMFIEDSKLDELYRNIKVAALYSQDNLKALADYVQEQCYVVGLYTTNYYWFGDADIFESFGYDTSSNVAPGSCVYK